MKLVSIVFRRHFHVHELLIILLIISSNSFAQKSRNITFSRSDLQMNDTIGDDSIMYRTIGYGPNGRFLTTEGKPELPVKYVRLIIPDDEDVSDINVTINSVEKIQLSQKIFPVQSKRPTSDIKKEDFIKPDKETYNSNLPYPQQIIKVKNDGFFDGHNHIITLEICPIRYYPVSNYFEFFSDLTYSLITKTSSTHRSISIISRNPKFDELYSTALKSIVDNPEEISGSLKKKLSNSITEYAVSTLSHYEYVIITTPSLASYFAAFVKWKQKKGLNVGIVTTDQIYSQFTGDIISSTPINDNAGKIRQ
jgi:Propeptide_C25/Peptidase family C25